LKSILLKRFLCLCDSTDNGVNELPTIVHFEISADDRERANEFYGKLFDRNIELLPGSVPYYLIQTTYLNGSEGVGG